MSLIEQSHMPGREITEDDTNMEVLKLKRRVTEIPVRIDSENTNISNSLGLICALSIPQAMCPSTHKEFLKKYEEENANKMVKSEIETVQQLAVSRYPIKMKPKIVKRRKGRLRRRKAVVIKKDVTKSVNGSSAPDPALQPLVQNSIVDDGRTPCCSKSLLGPTLPVTANEAEVKSENTIIKENMVKPKTKSKRWIEDETPVVNKIGPTELLINGKLVVINYTDYTKESDIPIPYDVDDSDLRPLPGYVRLCKKDFCQLGCICKSIAENEIVRSRCQNVKCMFGCICFPSSNVVDNDGDIRSRLRPRVSLLNWKHSDNTEKDTMANYKQLERGVISLRAKRTAQPPPRLRNEYVMEGVRNPLQDLPERNIRKRMRHKVQYYNMISNKGIRASGTPAPIHSLDKTNKAGDKVSVNGRANLKQKQSIAEVSMSSLLDNTENQSDFASVSTGNSNFKPEESQKRVEEEVPTILYQKIGTTPNKINEEFLRSSTSAITSYWSVKRVMRDIPPREQVKRHDGRTVFVSWTANRKCPKVIPQLSNPDKSIKGDHIMLPLLPENSEWLMYEFPKNYEKSSCVSFTDIGLIIFAKVLIFQKIKADINNKVVKMKLRHPERLNSKSSINLYLLPRVGNLVVLGPMKKDFHKTVKATFPQTLSYIRSLHRKNFFGSPHSWDLSFCNNQDKVVEPFHMYIQRKKREDTEVLTGRTVPPETMDHIIPELMETYEPDEIPRPFRPTPSLRKKHVMQLKWSDSIKCSAHFNPRLEPYQNAVPLGRFSSDLVDDVIDISSSELDDAQHYDQLSEDYESADDIKYEDCSIAM